MLTVNPQQEGGDSVDPLDCNHITVLPGNTPQTEFQDKHDKVSFFIYRAA